MKKLFTHAHLVVDGKREYEDGALLVEGDRILDVFYHSFDLKTDEDTETIDLQGSIVMPGFFDTHIHGCFGVDFNKCTEEELNRASRELKKKGTTSFFMSVLDCQGLKDRAPFLNEYKGEGSRFLGIHLEGPFLNREYRGAINEKDLRLPDKDITEDILSSSDRIKQMTVAPELEGIGEVVAILKKNGIRVMCGHSAALKKDLEAIDYDGFTHLFNACRGLHHRDTGPVNVALDGSDRYVELICDGIHVDPSVLKLAYRNIRKDRLIMISDSNHLSGMPDGEYVFEGERCLKKDNACRRISDGRLSASVSFMADGLRIMRKAGASLSDLLLMSSLNAYRFYGLDRQFGGLMKGKYADIVIMNDDLDVKAVYAGGEMWNA
ncbi:MAG: N-acetylglucosamine-6-phosphate deacetylase [Erysipelotrichaceae bacterium]|nr:N-acetylglucosamine-6-phosphate deacetylase [Erysipelotrichaceae bacterium]